MDVMEGMEVVEEAARRGKVDAEDKYGASRSLTYSEPVLALNLVQQIDAKVEFRIRGATMEASIKLLCARSWRTSWPS